MKGDEEDVIRDHSMSKPTEVMLGVKKQEELNKHFFSKIDEQHLNMGTREMLTLEAEASFENAFFIVPESRENLSKVLFVHTSVNCLNNLLEEVCNPNYGSSRDR
jgi:hypothetical protein